MKIREIVRKTIRNKAVIVFTLTKIPLLLYIAFMVTFIPPITAIDGEVVMGAHRGESVMFVENTAEAIQYAVDHEDYKFVEFDIQYTKDKEIVVFHDKNLFKTKRNFTKVRNISHEDLQSRMEFTVSTYEEIMEIVEDSKINIELKSAGNLEEDKEIIDHVMADLKKRGIVDNVMISSISEDVTRYVSDTYPEIKTGQIFFTTTSTFLHYDFLTKRIYDKAEDIGADYVLVYGTNIHNIDSLIETKPEDIGLCIWYLDNQVYLVEEEDRDVLWGNE